MTSDHIIRDNDKVEFHGALTERQRRELDFHESFACEHAEQIDTPVPLDIIGLGPRRPWNDYWSTYDELMSQQLAGKRVLVPGCGFGNDAIRLAILGANVYASDLSPDLVAIARVRAERAGATNIHFDVMPAEATSYQREFFDLVFFNDILHHVDIPKMLAETKRVIKPAGVVIANELYTHSLLQRFRESRLVANGLYPRMLRFIYGTDRPYITEDERKINERELAMLRAILLPGSCCRYFLFLSGRVVPQCWTAFAKLDHRIMALLGGAGNILAGRVLLVGRVAASAHTTR